VSTKPEQDSGQSKVARFTVDRERLRKRLGVVTPATLHSVLRVVAELFEP